MSCKYVDLTHSVGDNTPVFADDPVTRLTRLKSVEDDGYALFRFETCLHVGTHIDLPAHFYSDGANCAEYPVDRFCGEAVLLDFEDNVYGCSTPDGNILHLEESIEKLALKDVVVVIKTGHYRKFGLAGYFEDYPVLSMELARFLVEKEIKLLVVDMPSPDRSPYDVHRLLLGAGIPIVENAANLDSLANPLVGFEVFAFPLKLSADASLVRLVALMWQGDVRLRENLHIF